MTFSRRERFIVAALAAVLGALVLDWWVITPLLDRSDEVEARKTILLSEMASAENLLERHRVIGPRWRQMLAEGMKRDPAEAESQVLHALGEWADDAGLNLISLKPERSTKETLLPEIDFRAAGTGSMAAVSRFLWRLETARIPVKVKALQIGSRKEGLDDLSLQLQISTIYVASTPPPEPKAAKRTAPEGEEP
ncbi:MAG: hypothetical protein AMK72_12445 [Planctomycetes bacterium SM23_25]|nr:MAG: hypothetical protein AMS14_05335 [Planctomycetes bacterium DG_20]KPK44116.1 MAG: hypothetical protein AMK72_12445 [Planctomycetes bacterium SM23_25]